jgi:predicted AlkP superfamily pyrophosphatase or phosphodiesterase
LDADDERTQMDLNEQLTINDFNLLIAHTVGVDHAGHYYTNTAHPELERKVMDAQKVV